MHKILLLTLALLALPNAQGQAAETDPLTLDDMRTLADVFNQVRKHYVDEVAEQALLQAAIEGMLQELDPWSDFMDAEQFRQFRDSSEGRYVGIGVRTDVRKQRIFIESVTPESPAEESGVQPGDLLLAVDGQAVRGRRLDDSLNALLGEPGSTVLLRLQSPGQQAREVKVKRDFLAVSSVFRKLVDGDIGAFLISHFTRHTHEELRDGLAALQASLGRPLGGVIFDLRGNPGGVIESAVQIADGFLDQGLIVYTRSRYEPTQIEIAAQPGQWTDDLPLVILVDGRTASAAEVLGGALQDHARATIIGDRTFGKGSIQSVLALRNGSGLKLTTARYFTPSGRVIQDRGIEPDLILPRAPDNDQADPSPEPEPGIEAAIRRIRELTSGS
jgi:carboxyl-terminal processing protease